MEIENSDQLAREHFKNPSEMREIGALLKQILFTDHEADELIKADSVYLRPMTPGFSGSSIFKLEAKNKQSGIVSVPAVLKISGEKEARQEVSNYQKYVKWGLPYLWRVDVLGTGFTRRFGAVAYSFVMSGLHDFDALTAYIRNQDDDIINKTVAKLFSPEMKRWYGDELIMPEENINARYAKRYFRGENSRQIGQREFVSIAQVEFGASLKGDTVEIRGEKFRKPIEAIFSEPFGGYSSCICHGDLNSNNLLISEHGEIIFIDFQETGRGHVFEDFIVMESSLRLYYGELNSVKSGTDLLVLERQIISELGMLPPKGYVGLVASVRSLAQKNFPNERFENYLFGVAAFSFRLLRASNLNPAQKSRCVAAILAATEGVGKST